MDPERNQPMKNNDVIGGTLTLPRGITTHCRISNREKNQVQCDFFLLSPYAESARESIYEAINKKLKVVTPVGDCKVVSYITDKQPFTPNHTEFTLILDIVEEYELVKKPKDKKKKKPMWITMYMANRSALSRERKLYNELVNIKGELRAKILWPAVRSGQLSLFDIKMGINDISERTKMQAVYEKVSNVINSGDIEDMIKYMTQTAETMLNLKGDN
tara:strand:- start:4115 stop:4765 length:651 start_codon:yes stop_codon:yes gene_type:complete